MFAMTHCQTLTKDLIKSLYYTTNNNWEKGKKQGNRNQSSGLSYFLSLTRWLGKFDGVCELILLKGTSWQKTWSGNRLTKLKEQWGKSPVVLLHHPRKVLKSVGDTVTIATSYYRQLFHNAFSHYNFVVNQFSNGHVPSHAIIVRWKIEQIVRVIVDDIATKSSTQM